MPVCARVRVGVPVPIIDAGSVRPNHKKRHRAPPTLRRKLKRQSMRAKHSAPTDRTALGKTPVSWLARRSSF
jgi:hypothetical protein